MALLCSPRFSTSLCWAWHASDLIQRRSQPPKHPVYTFGFFLRFIRTCNDTPWLMLKQQSAFATENKTFLLISCTHKLVKLLELGWLENADVAYQNKAECRSWNESSIDTSEDFDSHFMIQQYSMCWVLEICRCFSGNFIYLHLPRSCELAFSEVSAADLPESSAGSQSGWCGSTYSYKKTSLTGLVPSRILSSAKRRVFNFLDFWISTVLSYWQRRGASLLLGWWSSLASGQLNAWQFFLCCGSKGGQPVS